MDMLRSSAAIRSDGLAIICESMRCCDDTLQRDRADVPRPMVEKWLSGGHVSDDLSWSKSCDAPLSRFATASSQEDDLPPQEEDISVGTIAIASDE